MRSSLLALAALAALAVPAASAATTHDVAIQNFSFNPQVLQISVGDTVVWTNFDAFPHTATDAALRFDSGDLGEGQSYARTFDAAGVFVYVCSHHPFMVGVMTVS